MTVRARERTQGGELRLRARGGEELAALRALLVERSALGRPLAQAMVFAGHDAWVKGGALRGSSSLRHALRAVLLRQPTPREREFENLGWLRERLFEALEPLAAGSSWSAGRPRFQVLVTAREARGAPLEECWGHLPPAERAELLVELAREVARLHALHFVHRDLFPRNLLLLPAGAPRRLVLLDAWAGGEGPGRRGPSYDLACLFLEAELFTAAERALLLATYRDERAAQGRPLRPGFARRVARARAALVERLRREPGRQRGRGLPGPWSPPPGALP